MRACMSSQSNANGVQHGEWAGEERGSRRGQGRAGKWRVRDIEVGGTAAVETDEDVGGRGQGVCLAVGSSSWGTKGESCHSASRHVSVGAQACPPPNRRNSRRGITIPLYSGSRPVRKPIRPVGSSRATGRNPVVRAAGECTDPYRTWVLNRLWAWRSVMRTLLKSCQKLPLCATLRSDPRWRVYRPVSDLSPKSVLGLEIGDEDPLEKLPKVATLCHPAQRSAVGVAPLRDARADRPRRRRSSRMSGVERERLEMKGFRRPLPIRAGAVGLTLNCAGSVLHGHGPQRF